MRVLRLALALAAAAALAACSGAPGKPASEAVSQAPDLALKDLSGTDVRIADFQGKVRLVNFWATWCAPCREEIPTFIDFEASYGPKGFAVLAIAMDEEGASVVKPFADEQKMTYKVLLGTEEAGDKFGGLPGYPTTFLVGRDGKILNRWVGLVPRAILAQEIEKALAS